MTVGLCECGSVEELVRPLLRAFFLFISFLFASLFLFLHHFLNLLLVLRRAGGSARPQPHAKGLVTSDPAAPGSAIYSDWSEE